MHNSAFDASARDPGDTLSLALLLSSDGLKEIVMTHDI